LAFVQIFVAPGVSPDQYDKVIELGQGGALAEGEIFHVAGAMEDGWWVIDAWESREQCNANMQRLMPAFQQAGIDVSSLGPPKEFEIHNLMVRG
jgi:hypothetical protein